MTRKPTVNIGASVRARLLNVTKERREDHTQTLMNYAAERFLYRLSKSPYRDQFVLKGAMLFAVRLGERYRPTRDLDLLGKGDPSEAVLDATIREIATTNVEDDGVVFDVDKLDVHAIREENKYAGCAPSCRLFSMGLAFTFRSILASATHSRRPQRN
jgi:predicted nucleotidyltransferase component of viral defense system